MVLSKLKNLFGASAAAQAASAVLPDGERVYAIGDIHGRLDLLTDLLARIDADDAARGDARTRIIFLGDLVDRGPDSAGVVELLATRDFGRRQIDFLLGNHEEVFLKALGGNLETIRFWLRIGGEETLLSYGTPIELIDRGLADELVADFLPRVPSHHVAFLHKMTDMVRLGDYCFVHAGVRPHVALDRQKPEDLRWIREQFLNFEGNFGATVVHGHSIAAQVEELPNRIGIDTGAYATGRLTALALEGGERWYLATEGAAG